MAPLPGLFPSDGNASSSTSRQVIQGHGQQPPYPPPSYGPPQQGPPHPPPALGRQSSNVGHQYASAQQQQQQSYQMAPSSQGYYHGPPTNEDPHMHPGHMKHYGPSHSQPPPLQQQMQQQLPPPLTQGHGHYGGGPPPGHAHPQQQQQPPIHSYPPPPLQQQQQQQSHHHHSQQQGHPHGHGPPQQVMHSQPTNDRVKVIRSANGGGPPNGVYGQRDSSEPESVSMVNGSSSGRREKRKRPNAHNGAVMKDRERERLHKVYSEQREQYTRVARELHTSPQLNAEFVMKLYPLSLERSAWLSAIEMEEAWALESARHTWDEERAKIEDEWKKGKERVRERLLDGIEERRRKAREEKESDGVLADAPAFDAPPPARPTKKTTKPAPFTLAASHPFGAAGEEMVSPFPLPLTAFSGVGGWVNGKRRPKGIGQAGGVTLGKAISNLTGLKESEIEYDMSEIKKGLKRKRARGPGY